MVSVCMLATPTWAVERPASVESDPESAETADREVQMRLDVQFLASEELRGRDTADETIHQAAKYVSDRMNEVGLDTNLIDDGPYQSVRVNLGAQPGSAESNNVKFTFSGGQQAILGELGQEINPLAVGSEVGNVSGKVVFVGYGITAPRMRYDDYAGIDVKGAIVIVLRKEPGAANPNSPFEGVKNTRHAYFATKIANAIKHGAAAVLIVNDQASIEAAAKIVRYKIAQEKARDVKIREQLKNLPEEAKNARNTFRMQLDGVVASIKSLKLELAKSERGLLGISDAGSGIQDEKQEQSRIPVVSIARDLADRLIKQTVGRHLKDIEAQIDDQFRPSSYVLSGLSGAVSVQLKPTSADSPNVIGEIAGRGELASETVIIGAHYDHVGMGGYGSLAPGTIAVHNGADDNASGVAVMLAAAKTIKQQLNDVPSHRRCVFIGFTGEERGLIGSKYYVDHPLYPLETTAAMLNLDMVGRLRDNELTVYGTGSGDAMEDILERSNEALKFDLFKIPTGYGPSDHQSFYKASIPVLFFFTGLHNDYHRPSDDFDKIDFGSMIRITDMVCDVTKQLAVREQRPEYVETENRVQIRRQLTAYLGVTLSDRGDHVVLSGVTAGGPAEQGGLRVGDQISRLGQRRVRTSSDVLELLRSRSPGDSLRVQVLRAGNLQNVFVKLGKRPAK